MIVRSREPLLLLLVNAVAVTLSRRLELVEIRRINATLGRIIYPTDSIDPTLITFRRIVRYPQFRKFFWFLKYPKTSPPILHLIGR